MKKAPKKQYAYFLKEDEDSFGFYQTFDTLHDTVKDAEENKEYSNQMIYEVSYKPIGKFEIQTKTVTTIKKIQNSKGK